MIYLDRNGSSLAGTRSISGWAALLAMVAAACSSSTDSQGGSGGASAGGSPGSGGLPAGAGAGAGAGGGGQAGASGSTGGRSDASAAGKASGATAGESSSGGSSTSGGQAGTAGSSAQAGAAGKAGSSAATGGASGNGGAAGASAGAGGAGGGGRSAGCGKTPKLKNSPSTTIGYNKITSAGLSRQYILRYPSNYDSSHAYRLVLAYHWYSGSASQVFDCNTESIKCYTTQSPFFGLWNLANDSTIFVAADGIDAGWANTNGRDLALTDDILREVEADLCIDTSRVFATGFSYGGAMTALLACERANVFRAAAVFAGGISGMSGACTGKMPIAYYGATGTQDSGYAGGQKAVQHFAEVNGCTAQTLPTPPTDGHSCVSFQGCTSGYPVRWCPFDDIHTPSPRDSGKSTTWQPAEVWSFFSQF